MQYIKTANYAIENNILHNLTFIFELSRYKVKLFSQIRIKGFFTFKSRRWKEKLVW